MSSALIAALIGLAAGGLNYWLLRGVMPGSKAASGGDRAGLQGLTGRLAIRVIVDLGALFLVFAFFRDQWAILGALLGLMVFPTVTVAKLYSEGRARRK
ncbi:MAG: hypothetical protein ACYC6V_01560 [Bacillota bacterium]